MAPSNLSAATALLLLSKRQGIHLKAVAKELANMHRQLSGKDTDPDAILAELRLLAQAMADCKFTLYVDDCPDITNEVGLVVT